MKASARRGEASLIWIGAYKFLHGALLAVVATGILKNIHSDLHAAALHWVQVLHLDADNRHVAALLHKAGLIDERQLKHLGGFIFAYSAVFMIEGVGLICKQRWAEYLTLVVTLSFVPIEIWEIVKHCTAAKVILLAVNLAIAAYLIVMLRRKPD